MSQKSTCTGYWFPIDAAQTAAPYEIVRESKIEPVFDQMYDVELPSARPYFVPMYGVPPQQLWNCVALNVWLFQLEDEAEPAYQSEEPT